MGAKDTKGTGCGIWPFLLKDSYFHAACEWHDKAYENGSWHMLNMSRSQVDKWFYAQMKRIAGTSSLRQLQADMFYLLARGLGWRWW